MESRYYLFAGQTLENTKISERAHALHLNETEWKKIRKHLDRKKDIQAVIDKEESKRRYLYDGNKEITDKWESQLEEAKRLKDSNRAKTTEEIQVEKVQKYYAMREEQEKVRKELVDDIKKKMFRTSCICKPLNSAFVASEVYYERNKQLEFKAFLKQHEQDGIDEYAQKVRDDAQKEAEEKKEQAQMLHNKNKEYATYLRNVVAERAAQNQAFRENEAQKELKHYDQAMEEKEMIKKCFEAKKLARKKEYIADMAKAMHDKIEYQKQMKQEEQELEEIVELYKDTKQRIDCMKIEKEKQIREDTIKRRGALAEKLGAEQKAADDAEERALKAAIAERDALEADKNKAKAEALAEAKRMRIEEWKKCKERREAEEKKQAELKKWEMLNQCKKYEQSKRYEIERKQELWKRILRYRESLFDQMAENAEERKRQESLECPDIPFDNIDATFFEYADEVLENAKAKGRNTYPIEKAIMEYKRTNHLLNVDLDCDKSPAKALIKKSKKFRNCRCGCNK